MLARLKNTVWHGMALGLVIPGCLSVLAWYIIKHVQVLAGADLLYIGSIAINLLVMKALFKHDKENAGRGVLAATFVCAFFFYFYKVL